MVPVLLPPKDLLPGVRSYLPSSQVPEMLGCSLDCRRRARCPDEHAGEVLAEDPFGPCRVYVHDREI